MSRTEDLLALSCDELNSPVAKKAGTVFAQFLQDCPGYVGEIARAVDSSLKHSRPSISLPAALAFCAAIKSGKVVSDKEIECNLYVLSLAPTGFGKTRAQNALEKIATQAGITDLFGLEPTSDAGLIAGLTLQPRQFIMWDEFGEALDDLGNAKNSPKATVLTAFTTAFSAAGMTLRGKQYADGRKAEAANVYLSVFGVSNEYSFFNALNERFLYNGFLGRWLCFAPEGEKIVFRDSRLVKISENCIKWLKSVDIWAQGKGNLGSVLRKEKKVIRLSANSAYVEACHYFDVLTEESKSEIDKAFWSRGAELFTKVCLVFIDRNIEVLDSIIDYCFKLTNWCISEQITRCKKSAVGTNDKARAKQRLAKILEVGQEITKTDLGYELIKLGLTDFEEKDIINRLILSKKWSEEFRFETSESRKKTHFYKRLK